MGKGYEQNQDRLRELSSYGKDLARRAKSSCELSQQSGIPLRIYEVPPAPTQPDYDRCLFLSEDTIAALQKPQLLQPNDWRHLGELIWSDNPLVQVMTTRILQFLAPSTPWCATILEDAYLDEDTLALANAAPLH